MPSYLDFEASWAANPFARASTSESRLDVEDWLPDGFAEVALEGPTGFEFLEGSLFSLGARKRDMLGMCTPSRTEL